MTKKNTTKTLFRFSFSPSLSLSFDHLLLLCVYLSCPRPLKAKKLRRKNSSRETNFFSSVFFSRLMYSCRTVSHLDIRGSLSLSLRTSTRFHLCLSRVDTFGILKNMPRLWFEHISFVRFLSTNCSLIVGFSSSSSCC